MTDEREPDPGEEFFDMLSKVNIDDPEWRVFVENARNNYRLNSRYTDEYWNQREAFLRQRAQERHEQKMKSRERVTLRNWLKRLFNRP